LRINNRQSMNKSVHEGLDAIVDGIIGRVKARLFRLSRLRKRSECIIAGAAAYSASSDAVLKQRLAEKREYFLLNRFDSADVNDALSLAVEAMHRTVGKRPYTVQVMGAIAMFEKYAIEMATGEGKTLTAGLSAVLFAWNGKPCHVVTANDYLAERDAQLLAPFYAYCGLRVGVIAAEMDRDERRCNYRCAITYATSTSLLADYLRDQMQVDFEFESTREKIRSLGQKATPCKRVMRGLHTAVVDEADSLLVDDAITPLIISIPEKDAGFQQATLVAMQLACLMQEKRHYTVDHDAKAVEFTDEGSDWLEERLSGFPEEWRPAYRSMYLVNLALVARSLYIYNKQYVILDGKIVIVDEKTGRLMNQRSWSHGLHQAIEAKEGLSLTDPTKISIKMSFQSFFRLYTNLCGMSGTFEKIERELWQIYGLPVVRIPTRLKKQHQYFPDQIHANKRLQEDHIIEKIQKMQQQGRPVLVGVRSVRESQILSDRLQSCGIKSQVLNALNHKREADIIARAGRQGCVTVATNMAGRGTDILLSEAVIQLGGLHVIATERHESRRVDLQLYGRASRQGQPGSSIAILSLEDQIMSVFLPRFLHRFLVHTFHYGIGRALGLCFYRIIQYRMEKKLSTSRIRLLIYELKLNKIMSFAGL